MSKKKAPEKPTLAKEQSVMQRLSQRAASWLIGMNARDLRDLNPPRNADGSYDAAEIVKWSVGRVGTISFSDEETERLLMIIDGLLPDGLATSVNTLREFQARYGGGALQRFAELMLEEWSGEVERNPDSFRTLTPHEITEKINTQIIRMRESHEGNNLREAHLRTIVCPNCDRIRQGRKWLKATSPPAGFVFSYAAEHCPDCECES